jgi:hypothetical protein
LSFSSRHVSRNERSEKVAEDVVDFSVKPSWVSSRDGAAVLLLVVLLPVAAGHRHGALQPVERLRRDVPAAPEVEAGPQQDRPPRRRR